MPWPDTAPHRLVRALGRLLAAERPPRVLPEVQEYFRGLARGAARRTRAAGYDDLERSLRDPAFRARFLANRYYAAMVRTTFAVNMLRGSEKLNVIPPEAVADIDCRMLAGDDPDEILAWVRGVIADEHVEVDVRCASRRSRTSRRPTPSSTRRSPTPCARRAPGTVVAPDDPGRLHRQLGVPRAAGCTATAGARSSSTTPSARASTATTSGVSLENIRAGVRAYTEMLLAVAAR